MGEFFGSGRNRRSLWIAI